MAKSRRVLIFAPAFAPFANPEAIANSNLAMVFLRAGWDVDVIARDIGKESRYSYVSGWQAPWLELEPRTHTVSYPNSSRFGRVSDTARAAWTTGHFIAGCRWAAHALEIAKALWATAPYDYILSRSGPDAAHLPALRLAAMTGAPWVANWNDPTADKAPLPYGGGVDARLGWFHQRFLNEVVRSATRHTFPCVRLQRYMAGYLGEEVMVKGSIIPHAAPDPQVQTQHVGGRTFTITHAGHLSRERNPSTLLAALARLKQERNLGCTLRVRLVGISAGEVGDLVKDYGLSENTEFCGSKGYTETLTMLSTSDINVIVEAPCAEGIFLPTKVVDYASVGRPILAVSPVPGTLHDLLAEYGGGLCASCMSVEEIYKALSRFFDAWRNNRLEIEFDLSMLARLGAPNTLVRLYESIFSEWDISARS